jgi:hypothetical protein
MDNANILLGIVIVVPVLTLVVAYLIEARGSSKKLERHLRTTVQCPECLGSNDPACASSCGMPT